MELVTLQQSTPLKSNGDDDALSRVKELEETLSKERRHNSEEVS